MPVPSDTSTMTHYGSIMGPQQLASAPRLPRSWLLGLPLTRAQRHTDANRPLSQTADHTVDPDWSGLLSTFNSCLVSPLVSPVSGPDFWPHGYLSAPNHSSDLLATLD